MRACPFCGAGRVLPVHDAAIACPFCKVALEGIRAFVANGGIDKSQDREIAQTRDKVDGLGSRASDLELREKILHKWKVGRIRYRGQ